MRRVFYLALALASLTVGALSAKAEPRTYVLDTEHVTVAFLVSHIGFAKVLGVFREVEGSMVFDEAVPALHNVEITVATDSVDTGHAARDRHVRSRDFLAAGDHPQMVFVLTGAEQTGERNGVVTGNLTLRGQTHPITLDVVWNKSGAYPYGDEHHAVGISARGEVDRRQWGMSYGVDNGLVGSQVEILIEAEFIRQD